MKAHEADILELYGDPQFDANWTDMLAATGPNHVAFAAAIGESLEEIRQRVNPNLYAFYWRGLSLPAVMYTVLSGEETGKPVAPIIQRTFTETLSAVNNVRIPLLLPARGDDFSSYFDGSQYLTVGGGESKPILIVANDPGAWEQTTASVKRGVTHLRDSGVDIWQYGYPKPETNDEIRSATELLMWWADEVERRARGDFITGAMPREVVLMVEHPGYYRKNTDSDVEYAIGRISMYSRQTGISMLVRMTPEYYLDLMQGSGLSGREQGGLLYRYFDLMLGAVHPQTQDRARQVLGSEIGGSVGAVSPQNYAKGYKGLLRGQVIYLDVMKQDMGTFWLNNPTTT
jgi:hypothetical protein